MSSLPLIPALQILRDARSDQIVVTSMNTVREWPKLSAHPLDFHYMPSTMGGAPPLGLGLALARPDREVIVLCGDGSLLMNLGSLVTIIASGAKNYTLVVIDNGVYEVTGGQRTAAAAVSADFVKLAQASGWKRVASFDDLAAWQAGVRPALAMSGPRLIHLRVEPIREDFQLEMPGPMAERMARFRQALSQPK